MRDALTGRPLFNEAARLDRSRMRPVAPLRIAVVSLLLVGACVLTDHQAECVPLTMGAVLVALADTGEPPGQRWRTMLWATTALAAATELGGRFSDRGPLALLVTVVVAAACGFAGSISARAGLVGVVSLVMFCAFSGAPTGLRASEVNALLVALGGVVITLATVLPGLVRRRDAVRWPAPASTTGPRDLWRRVREGAVPSNPVFWHGIRLPVAIAIATVISWEIPVLHSYWIPVTVAWVTLPDSHLTNVKLIARILGTLAGALAASVLLLPWLHYSLLASLVVALGAYLTVAFLFAFYAVAVAGITMVILGLFSIVGDPVIESILTRVAATIVAAGVVVVVMQAWSWAERRRHVHPRHP